jgi:hypothetical protein
MGSPAWLQFEGEIRALVEAFGCEAVQTPPSGDFGADVIAQHGSRRVVIQCKFWGKGSTGGDTIMKLVGSRGHFGASNAVCFTTSRFTKQAQTIAAANNVQLVDHAMLVGLCRTRSVTIPSLTYLMLPDGSVLPTQEARVTLGRDPANGLVLNAPQISRFHAAVDRQGLRLQLTDCGSTNGTFLGNSRLAGPRPLNYGDTIALGPITLRVLMVTPGGRVYPEV